MPSYLVIVREADKPTMPVELKDIEASTMWEALSKASEMMREWEAHEGGWPD